MNFMNTYVNPSCFSSLAKSCVESKIASSYGEGNTAAVFTEGVSSSAGGGDFEDINRSFLFFFVSQPF